MNRMMGWLSANNGIKTAQNMKNTEIKFKLLLEYKIIYE